MSRGDCLKKAFAKAGIDVNIPDWLPIEEMPGLCDELVVDWHDKGAVEVSVGDPVIVVYETTPGKAHAVLTTDARRMLDPAAGLVTFKRGARWV